MNLKSYLEHNQISPAKAAKELNISRGHFYQLLLPEHTAGKKLALRIMQWSNGAIDYSETLFSPEEKNLIQSIKKT